MNVILRGAWHARPPKVAPLPIAGMVGDVFIHHSADTPPVPNGAAEVAWMQQTQNYHMNVNGWNDIAYSWCVMPSGNVYEGRGWHVVGAHTLNHNSTSYGICFAGNYMAAVPTPAAFDACCALIVAGITSGAIHPAPDIAGHRNVFATACPGDQLYAQLGRIRAGITPTAGGSTMPPDPTPLVPSQSPVVAAFPAADGQGYWIVTADGAVFAFGSAGYHGRVVVNHG